MVRGAWGGARLWSGSADWLDAVDSISATVSTFTPQGANTKTISSSDISYDADEYRFDNHTAYYPLLIVDADELEGEEAEPDQGTSEPATTPTTPTQESYKLFLPFILGDTQQTQASTVSLDEPRLSTPASNIYRLFMPLVDGRIRSIDEFSD